jgi:phosphocarrier protein FPr
MITLDRNHIKLNVHGSNKAEAIRQAGALLVKNGNMKPDYITSMMEREKVANTYLGNGIAIPHGLPNDRDLILQTGISVVQIPAGVEWNPGERVHLVVGIAAKSDEHLEILSNLTHILDDEKTIQRLSNTSNSDEIVACLTNGTQTAPSESTASEFEKSVNVNVSGNTGLHARPATALVNLAKQFESEIRIRYNHQTANAKSLISLLKLGVSGGETVQLMADGTDADMALRSLKTAIESGLEEESDHTSIEQQSSARGLNLEATPIPGIVASPGLAIAPVFQFKIRVKNSNVQKGKSGGYPDLNKSFTEFDRKLKAEGATIAI